jgi:hypothetical protein
LIWGTLRRPSLQKPQKVCVNGTSRTQQHVGSDASWKCKSRPESDVGRNSHKPGQSQKGAVNGWKGIGKCMVVTGSKQTMTASLHFFFALLYVFTNYQPNIAIASKAQHAK